jgi:4'-phosphopantetheinyl transferase
MVPPGGILTSAPDGPPVIPAPVEPPAVPPDRVELEPDAVHVWQASLDGSGDESVLSPPERERAERAATATVRRRFVRGRSLLRSVLAAYSGVSPAELELGETPDGKPFLVRPSGPLRFNLTHTGSVWAMAVAAGRDLGIDVERTDRRVDVEAVSRRLFAPAEAEAIARLPEAERRPAFFRCWTVREAVVKACGTGMLVPRVSFEVDARPLRPLAVRATGSPPFPWWIRELPVPPGHVGALAVEGAPARVSSFALRDRLAAP